ncbi:MAG: DUF4870 domain-containing protein [Planctomycetaceae bacterium]|jgi:uncharacterized Tic20 family protein|nr:DUF4870 domain-containing protein [Planctomycetaceae bacterium]
MIFGMKPNTYCMLLHLSQLLNLIPGLGLIVPIVLWAIRKDTEPLVDRHGKIVLNWILSALIYTGISFILTFLGIGVVIIMVLAILAIVFPIIGGVKANDGIEWKYPLSITFFK